MPKGKNKRNKVFHLTQTKKKGNPLKIKVVNRTRGYLKKFKYCFVFQHQNMTNVPFRDIQENLWADSKFQLGKNKVIGVALGRDEEHSYKPNTWLIS